MVVKSGDFIIPAEKLLLYPLYSLDTSLLLENYFIDLLSETNWKKKISNGW